MDYDEVLRYPNEAHYEIKNAVQYYKPQDIGVSSTYIAQVSLVKSIDTIVHVRVAKLDGTCPLQFPIIAEGYARTFYHSKKYLMMIDIQDFLYHRGVFNHSRNCGFKHLNRIFNLGITPKNFREVVFIDFQSNDNHWRLKEGFSFNYVDMHSGRK